MIKDEIEYKIKLQKKSKIYKNIIFFWKLKILKRRNLDNVRRNDIRDTFSLVSILMRNNEEIEKKAIQNLKPFLQQLKKLQEIKIIYDKFMKCFKLIRML